MSEFKLIEQIRKKVSSAASGVSLGIGDDAALINVEPGYQLVASSDWLIESVHFPPGEPAAMSGYKALAVNLSDMAAMGAIPRWVLLSISSPAGDESWIETFMQGFLNLAESAKVALVGGDTSVGTRAASVAILGEVEHGRALLRNGAAAGDYVVVSGVTGEAALALEAVRAGKDPAPEILDRLQRPTPRVALGRALVGKASACIDISDGLLADLGHIVHASGCGAVLELEKLPTSPHLDLLAQKHRWQLQISGGDDYELCFTLPPAQLTLLQGWSEALNLDLTVVGTVCKEPGIKCRDANGDQWLPDSRGWEHFL